MMYQEVASAGGKITDIFYCPHLPHAGCDCRKPEPGLIFQARQKYNIELTDAVMVGDSLKDIDCSRNAGCGWSVLVKSGKDPEGEKKLIHSPIAADLVARNLFEAAEWIIANKA